MKSPWIHGLPPPEDTWYYEVLINGEAHLVQRVGSRAPLSLMFSRGDLVFSTSPPTRCDESIIEGWRQTSQQVDLTGTWDPTMYDG